jgi:NitT/TauT family transport system substrate-binding protein
MLATACGGGAAPASSPAAAAPVSAAASAKPPASVSAAASAAASGSASAKPAVSGAASASAAAKPAPSLPAVAQTKLELLKPLPPLNPPVTVKARVGSSLTTAPFWYAIEKGYFDQLGLKFEEVTITNSTDVVGPLTQGQIDVAGVAVSAGLYNAEARGVDVIAVSDNGKMAPNLAGAAAVVKKGTVSNYGKDWCGLKGKKVIASAPGSGLYATLVKALSSCNLSLKDVDETDVPFANINQAISNGAADVGFQIEPLVSAGVTQGILDIWMPLDKAFENQQMNLMLYSPTFVKNKDAGLRFMVAYLAGARDYTRAISGKGDRAELGVVMAKHLPIKDPKAYDGMIMMAVDPNGDVDMSTLGQAIKIFQDTGVVQPGPTNLNWVNDDVRKQAMEYLGPFKA